eukprot:10369968-Ditylum_brightwellii.AAC.1
MKLMTRSKAMLTLVTEFTRSTVGSAHSPGAFLLAMACICPTLLLLLLLFIYSTAPQRQDWQPACPSLILLILGWCWLW